jgi:hypothetical protein
MPYKSKLNNKSTLPVAPAAAVQHIIRLSQSLMTLAEKETQALLMNDMLAFTIMQHEKEKLAGDYMRASESFRNRLEEFRSADPNLLNRLERLQRDLTEKMNGNNAIVQRMRLRAQENAKKSLAEAREAGLTRRVHFKDNSTLTANESNEGVQS